MTPNVSTYNYLPGLPSCAFGGQRQRQNRQRHQVVGAQYAVEKTVARVEPEHARRVMCDVERADDSQRRPTAGRERAEGQSCPASQTGEQSQRPHDKKKARM